MARIEVSGLRQHPIKGCYGEEVQEMCIGRRGPIWDRRWVVVDEDGMFLAQRRGSQNVCVESTCRIRPSILANHMIVNAPGMRELTVPFDVSDRSHERVRVWGDETEGVEVGPGASEWFTEFLSRERPGNYRLMQMPKDIQRSASRGDAQIAYADGYPFLIISEASLDLLNEKIEGEPVEMDRFRPNVVISGLDPHQEDAVDEFEIEGIVFKGEKLCNRCSVPGIDQLTSELDSRPLATLAKYRRWPDAKGKMKVWFGRNFNHSGEGTLRQGSMVKIL